MIKGKEIKYDIYMNTLKLQPELQQKTQKNQMPDNSMKHVYILLYKGNVLNGSNEQQKRATICRENLLGGSNHTGTFSTACSSL